MGIFSSTLVSRFWPRLLSKTVYAANAVVIVEWRINRAELVSVARIVLVLVVGGSECLSSIWNARADDFHHTGVGGAKGK